MTNKYNINLLVDKRNARHFPSLKNRLKLFRLSSITLLFITGTVSMIISILIIFSPLEQLKKDEQKARDYIANYHLDMNKISFVNERSNVIRGIIKDRSQYDKKIDVIQSKMPPDVNLDGLTLAKKIYTLKFSSTNLSSLNDLLASIIDITGRKGEFTRVYLTSLSADQKDGKFVLILNLISV